VCSTDAAYAELDAQILAALDLRQPRRGRDLRVDIPLGHVIPALRQLAREGLAAAHPAGAHTTYTLTEAGRRHLDVVRVG
jgi:DNA-binding PadR family transcriptional regulator